MKTLAILIAALMGAQSPVESINARKVAAKDMKYSVLVHVKGLKMNEDGQLESNGMIGCSGTYVGPNQVLTAAHCFRGYLPTRIWVRGPDDLLGTPVKLKAISPSADLALLETPYTHPWCKLGPEPEVGDAVLSIGSPLFFEFVASQGIVALKFHKLPGFHAHYVLLTAQIDHGSSGGGAFDGKGRLIGVNTMMLSTMGLRLALAVDVGTIREFLDAVRVAEVR